MVGTGLPEGHGQGFSGAQEEDDGEVRHKLGDGSVCPGRAMVLVVSLESPCLGLGEDGLGECGFVQPPQGRVGPHRVGSGGFCTPPHSHLEAEVLLWLRDVVGVLEEGAALSAEISVPPAMLRLAERFGDALRLQIMRRSTLDERHPQHWVWTLQSP